MITRGSVIDRINRDGVNTDRLTYHEAKTCTGKYRHTSKRIAKLAIKDLRKHGHVNDKIRPYACQYCGFWHLGHK